MKFSEEKKTYSMNQLKEYLSCLASKKYQYRVWMQGIGPEYDAYDETYMCFDGFCDFLKNDYKDLGITDERYQKVLELRDALEKFDNDSMNKFDYLEDYVSSPEWDVVVKAAEKALEAFGWENNRE